MCLVLIVGGGIGQRFASPLPKQFWNLAGRPVILHSILAFERNPRVRGIYVVVPKGYVDYFKGIMGPGLQKIRNVVEGGRTRQESVSIGLRSIQEKSKIVLVHDAARPMVRQELIDRVIEKAVYSGCCVPVIPLRDTVKRVNGTGRLLETLQRQGLVQVQTPQAFLLEELLEAHKRAVQEGVLDAPDDSYLLEWMGKEVFSVEGDPLNMKVTYPSDLLVMEGIWKAISHEEDKDRLSKK